MPDILLILLGLGTLYAGGELLVRASLAIGKWLGLSPLVTGLTFVALGTSAPELAVSIDAALVGSADIAIANVVGSNFANIALVLALSAILQPIHIESMILRRDMPVMMTCFIAASWMLADGVISQTDGLVLLLALAGYLSWVIWYTRRRACPADLAVEEGEKSPGYVTTIAALLAGIALLALGGHWMVQGAVNIAARIGVSEAVIGMTVVAVGTSLPEITASIISILRSHGSMAVGNIVGSNIWNTLGVLGATSVIAPLAKGGMTPLMLVVMIGSGLLLWIFCRTSYRITRLEGALLLAGYVACQVWLFI